MDGERRCNVDVDVDARERDGATKRPASPAAPLPRPPIDAPFQRETDVDGCERAFPPSPPTTAANPVQYPVTNIDPRCENTDADNRARAPRRRASEIPPYGIRAFSAPPRRNDPPRRPVDLSNVSKRSNTRNRALNGLVERATSPVGDGNLRAHVSARLARAGGSPACGCHPTLCNKRTIVLTMNKKVVSRRASHFHSTGFPSRFQAQIVLAPRWLGIVGALYRG